MQINENEVYTPEEAKKILKVSSSTMSRLIKHGLIGAAKVGKQYRIMGKEILRMLSPQLEDQVGKLYNKGRRWIHEGIDDDPKNLNRAGIIIQARMSSRRLPGKMLKMIAGKTVLCHLIDRIALIVDKKRIVLATSAEKEDDALAKEAQAAGIQVFRGSLDDVLDRFFQAARQYAFDPIVRVTGDNPLLEPVYLQDLFNLYQSTRADYVTAKDPAKFPRGTTAEIISFRALEAAWNEGTTAEDREHVTWFIRQRPEEFLIASMEPRPEFSKVLPRLALDETADLEQLEHLFTRLQPLNPLFGLREISELYRREPEFFELNQHVRPTHS